MTTKYTICFVGILVVLVSGCDKTEEETGECGPGKVETKVHYSSEFFLPDRYRWEVRGNNRLYYHDWDFSNNCTKINPKVKFKVRLVKSNNTLSNPFTFDAGTFTCFGLQPQKAILSPNAFQDYYESTDSEIGMQQCFSGQTAAKIGPFMNITFRTLGSSQADSLYILQNLEHIVAERVYHEPK